ncbi:STAS domain-containing protein [Idiomarina xiamenensis]|uniref:STAS domain-containing protein n=1 Tax=Idiomarina xiamenensis 10-D-4 TaxID=740709 RepID=K2KF45_9GAMM|nr:STAS domain-containing protein [Idiomarina xiamenensis]EKE85367.1 STAS domain-containing protein [Idiomarina xiamenensis 10-D-4]
MTLAWQQQQQQVSFDGELTRQTVASAWQQRRQWLPQRGDVVVDLAQVSKVDSAGVAFLIEVMAELKPEQRRLTLQQANQQLREIVALSGVNDLLSLS